MTVRPARAADSEKIMDLLVQVNNIHEKNRPDLFIKDRTKYTKAELAALLADESRPIFVAEEDGAVLGYAFCVFEPHDDNCNLHPVLTLYIDDICIDEAARGKGVGTAIFEYVKAFAREKGVYNLTLNVWDKNDAARAFYEKCDFHVQKTGMELIL